MESIIDQPETPSAYSIRPMLPFRRPTSLFTDPTSPTHSFTGLRFRFLGCSITSWVFFFGSWNSRPSLEAKRPGMTRKNNRKNTPARHTMPAFLNSHGKARNRSVQLDSSAAITRTVGPASLEHVYSLPITVRTSSWPEQDKQTSCIGHYRSMLVVDTPSLGPHRPVSYDEFCVNTIPGISLRT
jgi:hypothetical protein